MKFTSSNFFNLKTFSVILIVLTGIVTAQIKQDVSFYLKKFISRESESKTNLVNYKNSRQEKNVPKAILEQTTYICSKKNSYVSSSLLLDDMCETEGTPISINNFGLGARTYSSDVLGHQYASTGNVTDGYYAILTSGSTTVAYNQTNVTGHKDAGNPIITAGSTNGRYLMINVKPNFLNQTLYRSTATTVVGTKYRFRIDMAGLADGSPTVPKLQLLIKDSAGNILGSGDSQSIGMANDDQWRRLAINFVATTTTVTFEIVNIESLHASGNDVGIDNIIIAPLSVNASCSSAIGCSNSLYLSQSASLSRITTIANPFGYTVVGSSFVNYNAIGINPLDGRMYGIQNPSFNSLLVVNADGSSHYLGAVTNLPTGVSYTAGEIDNLGNYYVKDNTNSNQLYKINLTSRVATLITLSSSINVPDFAFRQLDGLLYGINSTNGQMVKINPATGTVSTIGGASGAVSYGAMFASSTGEIYGLNNAGGFYQFDIVSGESFFVSASPASTNNDGAHCVTMPITFNTDLAITKTDNATTYTQGGTTVYTIVVSNNGPFGVMNATVSDPVPAGIPSANVSYTASVTGGAKTSVSGIQTGDINDIVNLPVNATVIYTVTVNIPLLYSGNLVNTATVTKPANIVETNTSNNTATDTNSEAVCYRMPITTGTALSTNLGITLLKRAGSNDPDNWPMIRKGGHIALESNTKGFVITRVASADLGNISFPQEGMMIYDITNKCLKIYSDGVWKCFNLPACP